MKKLLLASAFVLASPAIAEECDIKSITPKGAEAAEIAVCTRAIARDPSNPTYYAIRAAMYFRLDRKQESLADDNRAIELDPQKGAWGTTRGVRIFRSWLYEDLGDFKRALEDQEFLRDTCTKLKPGFVPPPGAVDKCLKVTTEKVAEFKKKLEAKK